MTSKWKSTIFATLLALTLGLVPFAIDDGHAAFPQGTVLYWPLDDAQQTAPGVYDEEILGALADGTCIPGIGDVGCPTAAPAGGQVDGTQTFLTGNGSDGIDVAPNNLPNWPANQSFSISLWINRASATALTENEVAIGQDDTGGMGCDVHWWIGLDDGNGDIGASVLSDNGVQNTASAYGLQGTNALNDDAWHHLVLVRDKANEKILLYIDGGTLVGAANSEVIEKDTTGILTNGFVCTEPMNIGYMDFQNASRFHFVGSIDEVALFGKALTAAEVEDIYNLGDGGTSLRSATVPTAAPDTFTTMIETDLNEAAPGVLANDSVSATQTVSLVTDVVSGTLTLNTDGSFLYSPDPGFTGDDTFTYKWNDGAVDSNDAIATITVTAAPVVPPINLPTGGGGGGGCFILTAGE